MPPLEPLVLGVEAPEPPEPIVTEYEPDSVVVADLAAPPPPPPAPAYEPTLSPDVFKPDAPPPPPPPTT